MRHIYKIARDELRQNPQHCVFIFKPVVPSLSSLDSETAEQFLNDNDFPEAKRRLIFEHVKDGDKICFIEMKQGNRVVHDAKIMSKSRFLSGWWPPETTA